LQNDYIQKNSFSDSIGNYLETEQSEILDKASIGTKLVKSQHKTVKVRYTVLSPKGLLGTP